MSNPILDAEKADLLETLSKHRMLFRQTVAGMSDEQARLQPTVSALSLGGLIKHVTFVESNWVEFILTGGGVGRMDDAARLEHADSFRLLDGDTLASVLDRYEVVAAHTDEVVAALPSLDVSQPLPPAPWFEPGARWSARRVLAHVIAETAQHAGHADILRETIDGAKTMG